MADPDFYYVNYASYFDGAHKRFSFKCPVALDGKLKRVSKTEFTIDTFEGVSREKVTCRVVKPPQKKGDPLYLLIFPFKWGTGKSLAFVKYRDFIRATNPEFIVDEYRRYAS